jgi:acyl dehydratase
MDQALGERLGYGGVILQGLGSCGISSRAVLRTYGGNEGAAFHSVRVRFSKPVLPGQTLETQMWLDTEVGCPALPSCPVLTRSRPCAPASLK